MKKILVTAIGGDIGYGIVNAIRTGHHDLYIVGCDVVKYNISRDLVNVFYECPAYSDEKKWLEFIEETIRIEKIDYFWPVTEPEMRLVRGNREYFDGVRVIMNEENVLNIALNKQKTVDFLAEAGFDVPKIFTKDECTGADYPMIVKAEFGCGSHEVETVYSYAELEKAYNRIESPIIQNYIGDIDHEYTMTVFSDGQTVNSIAFRRVLGFGGMSRYVELVHDDELTVMGEKLASLFELKGSINIQMRKSENRYYIFEINPRISSTIGFRRKLGFNDVDWWLDMVEGKAVAHFECTARKVYGARSVEEKLYDEDGNLFC